MGKRQCGVKAPSYAGPLVTALSAGHSCARLAELHHYIEGTPTPSGTRMRSRECLTLIKTKSMWRSITSQMYVSGAGDYHDHPASNEYMAWETSYYSVGVC